MELSKTERSYLRDLEVMIQLFLRPMRHGKLISDELIRFIFSNVEDVAETTWIIAYEVEQKMAHWNPCILNIPPFYECI